MAVIPLFTYGESLGSYSLPAGYFTGYLELSYLPVSL